MKQLNEEQLQKKVKCYEIGQVLMIVLVIIFKFLSTYVIKDIFDDLHLCALAYIIAATIMVTKMILNNILSFSDYPKGFIYLIIIASCACIYNCIFLLDKYNQSFWFQVITMLCVWTMMTCMIYKKEKLG